MGARNTSTVAALPDAAAGRPETAATCAEIARTQLGTFGWPVRSPSNAEVRAAHELRLIP
jgi:hypothetical protein